MNIRNRIALNGYTNNLLQYERQNVIRDFGEIDNNVITRASFRFVFPVTPGVSIENELRDAIFMMMLQMSRRVTGINNIQYIPRGMHFQVFVRSEHDGLLTMQIPFHEISTPDDWADVFESMERPSGELARGTKREIRGNVAVQVDIVLVQQGLGFWQAPPHIQEEDLVQQDRDNLDNAMDVDPPPFVDQRMAPGMGGNALRAMGPPARRIPARNRQAHRAQQARRGIDWENGRMIPWPDPVIPPTRRARTDIITRNRIDVLPRPTRANTTMVNGRSLRRRENIRAPNYVGGIQEEIFYPAIEMIRDEEVYPVQPLSSYKGKKVKRGRRTQGVLSYCELCNGTKKNVGAYELLTENQKIFYRDSLMKRYGKLGAVILTPHTRSLSCFLMSFIRAECRRYEFEMENWKAAYAVGLQTESNQEAKRKWFTTNMFPRFPFVSDQWNELIEHLPFVYYDHLTEDYYPIWFNTYYDENEPEHENNRYTQFWELAARELESTLVQLYPDLDVNSLPCIGQTVADYFGICISIYDVEYFGKRVWVFTPQAKSIFQMIANQNGFHMVSMLYDHGHMYGIRNLRTYLGGVNSNAREYSYCPICESFQTSELKTWELARAHCVKCLTRLPDEAKFPSMTTKDLRTYEMSSGVCPVKNTYHRGKAKRTHSCLYCGEPCNDKELFFHNCSIVSIKDKDKLQYLPEENLWVYDIEAEQNHVPGRANMYYHECRLIILRRVYPKPGEEEGLRFPNEITFMEYILEHPEIFKNCVILAHNGGAYDHQFMIRYLERMAIAHTYIPAPSSLHKFLSVSITDLNLILLDFIYFMPGSLKSIGEAFGLTITKGDFPHRFHIQRHRGYKGCIPNPDDENDWWSLQWKRKEGDVKEIEDFITELRQEYCDCWDGECHCTKKKWDMEENLYKYCLIDVIVLAECVRCYRNQFFELVENQRENPWGWKVPKLEPFYFVTIPQIALNLLLMGYDQPVLKNLLEKGRLGQCPQAIGWLESISKREGKKIYHRLNWFREFYNSQIDQYADGYCPETGEVWICLDCELWGCPHCYRDKDNFETHPIHVNFLWGEVKQMGKDLHDLWQSQQGIVKFCCEIEMEGIYRTPYYQQAFKSVRYDKYFYGGRTEVFQPYCVPQQNEEIKYMDVCSLYPDVCAKEILPCGTPEIIPGWEVDGDRLFHPDMNVKYWGYIRCRIIPNRKCMIGLLPHRSEEGRLLFHLDEQDGCWGLNEVELAVQNGYQISHIYEIIHFGPNERSDTLFRPYVEFFLTMKQESEGWEKLGASSKTPTEEEMVRVADQLFHDNGELGHIHIEKVKVSKLKRAFAKLLLNSLWGKLAQKTRNKMQTTIYSMQKFNEIWNDPRVDRTSCLFREISRGVFRMEYVYKMEFVRQNARGNVLTAAKVTEHSRCRLHRQMLRIGMKRIIYCDTDSIIALLEIGVAALLMGIGLGKWTDEYKDKVIRAFFGLAPKTYMLELENKPELEIKAKGIQLSLQNKRLITKTAVFNLLQAILHGRTEKLELQMMQIKANCHDNIPIQYGVLLTTYGVKQLAPCFTKRKLETPEMSTPYRIRTYPFGYDYM